MSVLEDYEERFSLSPVDLDEVLSVVDSSARQLHVARDPSVPVHCRVVVWLHDRVKVQAAELVRIAEEVPQLYRCVWCFHATSRSRVAWNWLPAMTFESIQAHAQTCEHSPVAVKARGLEQELEKLRGEVTMYNTEVDASWRDAVRALIQSDKPAGELRQALEELVR
jgi:hypothetical protein